MSRNLGRNFNYSWLISFCFLSLVTSTVHGTACVITNNNSKPLLIGERVFSSPILMEDCCSLEELKSNVSICFTKGNYCTELKPGEILENLNQCKGRTRVSKLNWLVKILQGNPNASLAMQRGEQYSDMLLGFPYGDIFHDQVWTIYSNPLPTSSELTFVIDDLGGITILSLPFNGEILKIPLTSLDSQESYIWSVKADDVVLASGEFYTLSTADFPGLHQKYKNLLDNGINSKSQVLSFAMDLYDKNLTSNAHHLILFNKYKNRREL